MPDFQMCMFCGEDGSAPDHLLYCSGRQGGKDDESETERINRHRESSAQAFYNAVNTGTIKTLQQHVYAALVALGPSDQMAVNRYFRDKGVVGESHSITPRFAELRDLGFIREVGERPSHVTGQNSIVWEAVPLEDYRGPTIVRHRCEKCHQLISRTVKKKKP